MSVSVISNTEPKNANFYTAALAGGVGGMALRHFKPVTKNEIDTVLFGESDVIRMEQIKAARKNAIDEVVKLFGKDKDNEALKLFLERTKASIKYANILEDETLTQAQAKKAKIAVSKLANTAKEKIKASPQNIQDEIKLLTAKVIKKVRAAKVLSENSMKSAVKHSRPVSAYLLPGVALGMIFAYVYNVVGTISKK